MSVLMLYEDYYFQFENIFSSSDFTDTNNCLSIFIWEVDVSARKAGRSEAINLDGAFVSLTLSDAQFQHKIWSLEWFHF